MKENPNAVPGTWNTGTNYADSRYQLPQIDSVDEVLNLRSAHVDRDAVFIVNSNLSAVDITVDVYRGVRRVDSLVNPA